MNLNDIEEKIIVPKWLKDFPENSRVCVFGGSLRDIFIDKASRDYDYNVCQVTEKQITDLGFVNQNHQTQSFKLFTHEKYPDDEIMLVSDLVDELKELDLTVHCVGYEFNTNTWLDPTQKGIYDLEHKILRMPNTDLEVSPRFTENRVLRLMRLSLTLGDYGFTVDEKTKEKAIWLGKKLGFKGVEKKRLIKQIDLVNKTHAVEFKKLLKDWGLKDLLNEAIHDEPIKSKKFKLK